jgi:hypothetical protein
MAETPETIEVNVVMGAQLRAIVRSALIHVRNKYNELRPSTVNDYFALPMQIEQILKDELAKWPLSAAEQPDTLAQWLHKRFGNTDDPAQWGGWDDLSMATREYWEHEAAAVRRAVGRGGFKTSPNEVEISHPIGDLHEAHANSGGEIKSYRQLELKYSETLGEAIRIAVGAASMTWTNMQGAGVFKSEVALDIATQLEHHFVYLMKLANAEMGERHQALGKLLDKYRETGAPLISIQQAYNILCGQAKPEEYNSALQELPNEASDPTHGRIDKDIQEKVEDMNPTSLGQRVAMENTLQNRRNDHG